MSGTGKLIYDDAGGKSLVYDGTSGKLVFDDGPQSATYQAVYHKKGEGWNYTGTWAALIAYVYEGLKSASWVTANYNCYKQIWLSGSPATNKYVYLYANCMRFSNPVKGKTISKIDVSIDTHSGEPGYAYLISNSTSTPDAAWAMESPSNYIEITSSGVISADLSDPLDASGDYLWIVFIMQDWQYYPTYPSDPTPLLVNYTIAPATSLAVWI
jgi:hypothetical protein